MNNSEFLKELAERGDGSLQAWFDAERVEETNVTDGETNGIADGSPLVDELGEITHEVSELMKKQPYTFDVNDVQGSIRLAGRYIDELTAERDGWKAKAEYCERNDGLPSENDVSANDVNANNANATQDSREKLEADVRKHYAYSTTTLLYPPSANKTTDMLRSLPIDIVVGWLDRQAAITERDVRTYLNREDSELVQAKVDNLQKQIEHLREEIAKRDKGIERLKNQRDEARAQLENLARDLDESEKLREELRAKFGKACDYANELYALMDL